MQGETYHLASGVEDKFIELLTDVFVIENTKYIAFQCHFVEIYDYNR